MLPVNRHAVRVAFAILFAPACLVQAQTAAAKPPSQHVFDGPSRAWLQQVRIAAYPLTVSNADAIVRQAEATGVYGIEVDNDIPGRYESLLDPNEKLEAIRRVATVAHRHRNKAFVYIAGLECISMNADGPHTLAKDHPQWLQRKITGEPAIFNAKAAFWIKKGEEDVWVSPTRRTGARGTCSACARSRLPASTASMSISPKLDDALYRLGGELGEL
jgi:hypothetical protein